MDFPKLTFIRFAYHRPETRREPHWVIAFLWFFPYDAIAQLGLTQYGAMAMDFSLQRSCLKSKQTPLDSTAVSRYRLT